MNNTQAGNTPVRCRRIESGSYTNGPGPRTVVWFQGCSRQCPGCQNSDLWPSTDAAAPVKSAGEIATLIHTAVQGQKRGQLITITGGEPFDQPEGLAALLWEINALDADAHVIVYTGYTFEELTHRAMYGKEESDTGVWVSLLAANVLVDGAYDSALDSPSIQWRGSSNQRVIDLVASLYAGPDEPEDSFESSAWFNSERIVLLDWDTPAMQFSGGNIIATGGLIEEWDLAILGKSQSLPRCGEVRHA